AIMKGEEAWTPECAAAAATDFGFARKIDFGESTLDFTNPEPRSVGFSAPDLKVKLASFPGISWPVKEITSRDDGVAIAKYECSSAPAKVKGSILRSTIGNTILEVISGQEDKFSKLIADVISKPSRKFLINGNSDVTLEIPSFSRDSESSATGPPNTLTATNIGISAPVTLRTLDTIPIEHLSLTSLTKDADSGKTTMVHTIKVRNQSQLNLKLGDAMFNLLDANGELVGVASIPDLFLARGDNEMTATTTFNNLEAYDILRAQSNTYSIVGFEGSVKNPILANGMTVINSPFVIPKLEVA
ncbi:hypothetical protein BX616_006147, partial [Lobosporangium transversale]